MSKLSFKTDKAFTYINLEHLPMKPLYYNITGGNLSQWNY